MKILILWGDLPSPTTGSSISIFNLLPYLKQNHDLTLLTFQVESDEPVYLDYLKQHCEVVGPIPKKQSSEFNRIVKAVINTLDPRNLFSRNQVFFNLMYSPEMRNTITHLLSRPESFDLIYCNLPMAIYAKDIALPKVVIPFDCTSAVFDKRWRRDKIGIEKFLNWLRYIYTYNYEKEIYKKFDACIVVNTAEAQNLKAYFPNANAIAVPLGVNTAFFKPTDTEEDWPSLIYVGDLGYVPAVDAVSYFYNHIYGIIKERIPDIKFFIVGRNTNNALPELKSDPSVTMTGFVDDVREYLSRASIFISPFPYSTGMKHKILDAMAMGMAVISTPFGMSGIDAQPDDEVIIAEGDDEFVEKVVKLLNDRDLRRKIGLNARKLMENKYSWETRAESLNALFAELVSNKSTGNSA